LKVRDEPSQHLPLVRQPGGVLPARHIHANRRAPQGRDEPAEGEEGGDAPGRATAAPLAGQLSFDVWPVPASGTLRSLVKDTAPESIVEPGRNRGARLCVRPPIPLAHASLRSDAPLRVRPPIQRSDAPLSVGQHELPGARSAAIRAPDPRIVCEDTPKGQEIGAAALRAEARARFPGPRAGVCDLERSITQFSLIDPSVVAPGRQGGCGAGRGVVTMTVGLGVEQGGPGPAWAWGACRAST
jgi:hypothetical protein